MKTLATAIVALFATAAFANPPATTPNPADTTAATHGTDATATPLKKSDCDAKKDKKEKDACMLTLKNQTATKTH